MRRNKMQLTVTLALMLVLGSNLSLATSARAPLDTNDLRTARSRALDSHETEMRNLIESYSTDRGILNRTYPDALTPSRRARFKQFYEQWRDSLSKLDFNAMGPDDRIDYVLFRNHLNHELLQLDIQTKQLAESDALIPFASTVFELEETRRRMEPVNSAEVAAKLNAMNKQIDGLRRALGSGAAAKAEDRAESKANSEDDAK